MNPVKAMYETTDQPFPKGTKAAGFLLTLTLVVDQLPEGEAAPTVTGRGALDAREITIEDVPPGVYVGKIALVDADDKELAPAVVDPATLIITDVAPVSLPVPSSLSLTRP